VEGRSVVIAALRTHEWSDGDESHS